MSWDQHQSNYNAGRGFLKLAAEPQQAADSTSGDAGDDDRTKLAAYYAEMVGQNRAYFEQVLPNRILDAHQRREEVPWWARMKGLADISEVNRDWRTYHPTPIRRGPSDSGLARGVVDTIGRGVANHFANRDAAAEVTSLGASDSGQSSGSVGSLGSGGGGESGWSSPEGSPRPGTQFAAFGVGSVPDSQPLDAEVMP